MGQLLRFHSEVFKNLFVRIKCSSDWYKIVLIFSVLILYKLSDTMQQEDSNMHVGF